MSIFCIDINSGLFIKVDYSLSISSQNVDLEEGNKDKLDPMEVKFENETSKSRKFIKTLKRRVNDHRSFTDTQKFMINIIEGKILGKRERGRPRKLRLFINQCMQIGNSDMNGAASDEREWL